MSPPPAQLTLLNRQKTRRIPTAALRRTLHRLLRENLQLHAYTLGIHFVGDPEMTQVNEQFLQHAGSTDVITFDHLAPADDQDLHGELFICVDEAIRQARRFRTTWQDELLRYAIHGILHLLGHDDLNPAARRRMKAEENRLLRRSRPLYSAVGTGSTRSLTKEARSSRHRRQATARRPQPWTRKPTA